MNTRLRVIITGATGMVGEGVLHECLRHPQVETVLVINRKACGVTHPKLNEIIHANFFDFSSVESQLTGYNTCFFCLGVSSVGMKEAEYYKLTYSLTLTLAETLSRLNTGMTFCYISGAGTDSTEKGSSMWARIKGKTENDLMKLPFKEVYAFRPGYIHPGKGLTRTKSFYRYILWLYPVLKAFLPKYVSTLQQVALAMINTAYYGFDKKVLEVRDINEISGAGQT